MRINTGLTYGLKFININGLNISNANSCVEGWRDFYIGYRKPYKKWFNNWFFHNRSYYDEILSGYRIWFCLFGFTVTYTTKKENK